MHRFFSSLLIFFVLIFCCDFPSAADTSDTVTILTTRITPDPDSDVMKRVEELTGIRLNIIGVSDAHYAGRLSFLLASNNAPDVYAADISNQNYNALSTAAAISWEEMEEWMPDICATIRERAKSSGISLDSLLKRWSVNGELKGYTTGQYSITIPYGILIRTDILDELGFTMPRTIDDWDRLLHAYKEKYPDHYPLTCSNGGSNQAFYSFISAYGVRRDEWILRDNRLDYAPLMDGMRDALLLLHRWYEDGLIDPSYFLYYADNSYPQQALIRGDTFFYQYYSLENALDENEIPGSLTTLVRENFPDAAFDWCPFPTVSDEIKPVVGTSDIFSGFIICFGEHLEHDRDKLHTIMRFYNELHTNKELYLLQHCGIEGVTYDWNKDHIAVVRRSEYPDYDSHSAAGFGWVNNSFSDACDELRALNTPLHYRQNIANLVEDPAGMYSSSYVDYLNWPRVNGPLITKENTDLSLLNEPYLKQWDSMFTGVILGIKTFDELDAFLEEWRNAVGNEMISLANELYLDQYLP